MLITCYYRPPIGAIKGPIGAIKGLNSYLEIVFKKANTENKLCFVVGDFNLNCLDYNVNLKDQTFYNQLFAHGCISLITRPIRVTSKTVSLIDNICTNFIFDTLLKLKKGIIKRKVSDHFPVFVSLNSSSKIHKEIQKRVMHDTNLMVFKTDLCNWNRWNSINYSPETNSKYETFFKIFSELYERHFPLKDFQIKVKDLHAPWISKGLKKLSKEKQKLYIKFLKDKSI